MIVGMKLRTRGGRPAVRDIPGEGKYIVWGIFHLVILQLQRNGSPVHVQLDENPGGGEGRTE